MDKSREQFEEWAEGKYAIDESKYGGYISECTQHAWQTWQASRAALVVQLPAPCYRAEYIDHCSNDLEWDNYFEIEEVKSSLSEAGIKCS